jgi:hypothetical protein
VVVVVRLALILRVVVKVDNIKTFKIKDYNHFML